MNIGYQLTLEHYNELIHCNIGDTIAIIDYMDNYDFQHEQDIIGEYVYLTYNDFIMKTKIINHKINEMSQLKTFNFKSVFTDDSIFYDDYQSVEVEILEISNTTDKYLFYRFDEFILYNKMINSYKLS